MTQINELSRENFHLLLDAFIKSNKLAPRRVAAAIPCSDATLMRLTMGLTLPTDEMLREGAFLMELGFERYGKLSQAQRQKLSESLGVVGGGTVGFASVSAAVSTLSVVSGLSAAGISSGLASLCSIVGGGTAAGVSVAAGLPVAAAGIGYGIARGVKHAAATRRLNQREVESRWEIMCEPAPSAEPEAL